MTHQHIPSVACILLDLCSTVADRPYVYWTSRLTFYPLFYFFKLMKQFCRWFNGKTELHPFNFVNIYFCLRSIEKIIIGLIFSFTGSLILFGLMYCTALTLAIILRYMQGCFKQFCEQKEWKIVMQNASLMPCLFLQCCGAHLQSSHHQWNCHEEVDSSLTNNSETIDTF